MWILLYSWQIFNFVTDSELPTQCCNLVWSKYFMNDITGFITVILRTFWSPCWSRYKLYTSIKVGHSRTSVYFTSTVSMVWLSQYKDDITWRHYTISIKRLQLPQFLCATWRQKSLTVDLYLYRSNHQTNKIKLKFEWSIFRSVPEQKKYITSGFQRKSYVRPGVAASTIL